MALTSKPLTAVRPSIPVKEVTKGDQVRVNLNVSQDTRNRWKIASIERGVTMAELIAEAVESHIAK